MTLSFPKPIDQPCSSTNATSADFQAQKKGIAALLSNHTQPNHNTTVTLSDRSGKTVSINCNTDDPAQLLTLAIDYLRI
ncbi:hypothetical protein [Psychrobacter fulvigenes]|uniref:hypothetical protein n=1 Tax=Psychrobacter fulvigenes TaxID=533323 RepID=UPI001919B1EA|nr:hypothetical protein [Psychrobacter fulvigenes]